MVVELTDQNFEEQVLKNDKPVVVDFFAEWCSPCFVLGPILEKLAEDFQGKFILAKANLENAPLTAQKFGIDQIPTVIFFRNRKTVSGFLGLQPEETIRKWLEENLPEKTFEELIKEYEAYAAQKGIKLNSNREVVERIIKGLLANEKKYGKRYCPCRRVTGNVEADAKNICPCAYHLEEIEKLGRCLCGLFQK